ncbi:MAG: hypothetical protein WDO14_14055 [Bacteroidota bacterium]
MSTTLQITFFFVGWPFRYVDECRSVICIIKASGNGFVALLCMMRFFVLVLLLLAMISCNDDDRQSLSRDELEAEIIDMNWYSGVTDLYVPEVFDLESSLEQPQQFSEIGKSRVREKP